MKNYKLEREVKKKTEKTGRSPLRRRLSELDCGAIEEEKDGSSETNNVRLPSYTT
jgi:hypothetical protein